MVNISAAMAKNLVEVIFEMVDNIKKLGPNPLQTNTKILKSCLTEIYKNQSYNPTSGKLLIVICRPVLL
jgi:hypothetical protein